MTLSCTFFCVVSPKEKRNINNDLVVLLSHNKKCVWKVKEINFLGLVMGAKGIIQKEKVVEVLEWSRSKAVKDVQKFLGLANYYRQFVKDFAKIAKPMYRLVRKNKKWNWENK